MVYRPKAKKGFVKMDETLERILELMKEKRVTAVAMEDLLEVPHGSFSNWKRGKGRSYYEHMAKISDKLEVSVDFLIRGRNDSDTLSGQERKLIEGFRKLSDEAQEVIIKNVKLLEKH